MHVISKCLQTIITLERLLEKRVQGLFMDVGLLAAKSKLKANVLLDGNAVFREFKGALAEQYVLQQLIAEFDIESLIS